MKILNEFDKVCGVYMLYSTIDKRVYIGSSNNLKRRLGRHFSELKNNTHCNIYLQRFVNKYGLETLNFKIIDFCSESELTKIETKRILEFDSFESGFNLAMPDLSRRKKESYTKVAEAIRNKPTNKIIEVLKDKIVIHTGNISSVKINFKVDESSVYKILNGKRKIHKGLSFRIK